GGSGITVVECYVPEHFASDDYFQIPRTSIAKLFDRIRGSELMVAAQVHTHPHEAFHSHADDQWAIIRHVGAVSVVLPNFGLQTTVRTFLRDAAVYALSNSNVWERVNLRRDRIVEVTT